MPRRARRASRWRRRAHRSRCGRLQRRRRRRSPRTAWAALAHAVRRTPCSARSLSAVTWAMVAKTDGFPICCATTCSSRATMPASSTTFSGAAVARRTDRLCLRAGPRRSERADADARNAGAPAVPRQCAADGDSRSLRPQGDRAMRERHFGCWRAAACTSTRSDDATVVTTPTDFERLFPATGGALYGPASHGWMASFRRPGARSRLPGLYLAGGSMHPGPGVPMAALSGRSARRQRCCADLRFDRARPGRRLCLVVCRRAERRRPTRPHDHRLHRQRLLALLRLGARGAARPTRSTIARSTSRSTARAATLGDDGARRGHVGRARRRSTIGPSALAWDGDTLAIRVDEVTVPAPTAHARHRPRLPVGAHQARLRARPRRAASLAADRPFRACRGRPRAPALRWEGDGYLDSNTGNAPLEATFDGWNWSRAASPAPPPCSTTSRSATALNARWPCASTPRATVEDVCPAPPPRGCRRRCGASRAPRAAMSGDRAAS